MRKHKLMIRNWPLYLIEWIVALVTYAIILVPWILGYHVDLSEWYRPYYWLDAHRLIKCENCGFSIRRSWNFCPVCADRVQNSLIEEMERKSFAQNLNHMFKIKPNRNLST